LVARLVTLIAIVNVILVVSGCVFGQEHAPVIGLKDFERLHQNLGNGMVNPVRINESLHTQSAR